MVKVASLIIPTYKEQEYIPTMLGRLFTQTIIDDCEVIIAEYDPDDTRWMQSFVSRFNKINRADVRVVNVDKEGIGHARGFGCSKATTNIFMNLDADGYFLQNDAVERLIEPIQKGEAVLTCCNNYVENEFENMASNWFYGFRRWVSSVGVTYEPGMTVSREAYEFVGGFKDLKMAEGIILDLEISYAFPNSRKFFKDIGFLCSDRRMKHYGKKGLNIFDYNMAYR